MSTTPEYIVWAGMKARCCYARHKAYADYGGRGIKVCDRWLNSFENFFQDMGERPSTKYSIERLDNDGDYSPTNCHWALKAAQSINRSDNRLLTYEGKTLTVSQWADELGISHGVLRQRLSRGWSIERTLSQPVA
jgi:hypothetical protein